MRVFAKVAIRVAFVLSIIVLFFGVGVPQVLGMGWPRTLGRTTQPVHVFQVTDVMPGDTFSKTLRFHNRTSRPLRYRLVLVRRGPLWECDSSGNSLQYELTWSPGADRRLRPGETESVTISVTLPEAAGNACQGQVGWLVVRRGYLGRKSYPNTRGIYECRPSPYARSCSDGLLERDDLRGLICGRVDRLFLNLLYPKQRR